MAYPYRAREHSTRPPIKAPWADDGKYPPPRPPTAYPPNFERPPLPRVISPSEPLPGPSMEPYGCRTAPRLSPDYEDQPSDQDDDTPNDCEIVLTTSSPEIERYVDIVEREVKRIGLKVDVMVPKEQTKLTSLLDVLVKKGVMFAVIIKGDNAAHNSLNVHVLRGVPKPTEHRNIPVEEAYRLMHTTYWDIRSKEVGLVPEPIKVMFKAVLDERNLSESSYSALIAFLQERRKRQIAFENRTPVEEDMPAYTTEELQHKILSIICEGADPKLTCSM